MGWAIMFLVLIALVIILSISLINWKIQIYKVIVQLNAILNRKTKKLVTVSLSDRRLEHLVEIINQIVSKDNIYLGEIHDHNFMITIDFSPLLIKNNLPDDGKEKKPS